MGRFGAGSSPGLRSLGYFPGNVLFHFGEIFRNIGKRYLDSQISPKLIYIVFSGLGTSNSTPWLCSVSDLAYFPNGISTRKVESMKGNIQIPHLPGEGL